MHLFKDYGRFVNPAIHIIWFLLMIVGLSSAYFHATLSLIGKKNHEFISMRNINGSINSLINNKKQLLFGRNIIVIN